MKSNDLSEVLSRLQEKSQKNLVLVAAYFLQQVQKGDHFSAREIKDELVGRVSGASKINVGAVFLNHCAGLVAPLKEKSTDGSKAWRLTGTGREVVSSLLGDPVDEISKGVQENFSLSLDDLHPAIQEASTKLFRDGHLSGAVESAFKAVNKHVRKKTGRTSDGGVGMMHKIFSSAEFRGNKDCLRLNGLGNQSDKDQQEGYKFLYAGAQQGIRNPFDHDGRLVNSEVEALEYLAFASHLARVADRAQLT